MFGSNSSNSGLTRPTLTVGQIGHASLNHGFQPGPSGSKDNAATAGKGSSMSSPETSSPDGTDDALIGSTRVPPRRNMSDVFPHRNNMMPLESGTDNLDNGPSSSKRFLAATVAGGPYSSNQGTFGVAQQGPTPKYMNSPSYTSSAAQQEDAGSFGSQAVLSTDSGAASSGLPMKEPSIRYKQHPASQHTPIYQQAENSSHHAYLHQQSGQKLVQYERIGLATSSNNVNSLPAKSQQKPQSPCALGQRNTLSFRGIDSRSDMCLATCEDAAERIRTLKADIRRAGMVSSKLGQWFKDNVDALKGVEASDEGKMKISPGEYLDNALCQFYRQVEELEEKVEQIRVMEAM